VDGDPQAQSNEKPRHKVFIDAFWMYNTEVTNAMYALCVKANICTAPSDNSSYSRTRYYDDTQFANYPVIYVSWNDAKTYCEWAGGRLPTEAEWEKAARGGLEGKIYPWGDEAPVCDNKANNGANFGSCSQRDTTLAGYFKPNGYGLFDMAGNVWEWVNSLYKPYPFVTTDGREDLTASGSRVLRGGSWSNGAAQNVRVSFRSWNYPDYRNYDDYGFRCAHSP
jgi:formylglycine-generating enzyme required for sulfatase activity